VIKQTTDVDALCTQRNSPRQRKPTSQRAKSRDRSYHPPQRDLSTQPPAPERRRAKPGHHTRIAKGDQRSKDRRRGAGGSRTREYRGWADVGAPFETNPATKTPPRRRKSASAPPFPISRITWGSSNFTILGILLLSLPARTMRFERSRAARL
jgi:hypothetical protein